MAELSNPPFFIPENPRRKSSFDSSNAVSVSAFTVTQTSDSSLANACAASSFSNQYNSMLLGPHDSISRINGRRPSIGTVSLFGMDIINTSMVGGQFVTEDKVDSIFNFEPPTFEDLQMHFNLESINEENDKELTQPTLKNDTSNSSTIINHNSKQGLPVSDFINRNSSSDYQGGYINSRNASFQNFPSSSAKRTAEFEDDHYKRSRIRELMHHNGMQNQESICDGKSFMRLVSPTAIHHPSTSPAVLLEMTASSTEICPIDHNISNIYHPQYQNQENSIAIPPIHELQHQYQHHISQQPHIHQFIPNETMPVIQTPASQYSFNFNSTSDLSLIPSLTKCTPLIVPNGYIHTQNGHYQCLPQYQNQQIMHETYNNIPHHNPCLPQYAPKQQKPMEYTHNGVPISNQNQSRSSNNSDSKSEPDLDNDINLEKKYKCLKPWCSKIYKNSNGLKYHMEHGNCELDYTSTDGAIAAALEFDENGVPLSNHTGLAPPNNIKITHRPYWCKVSGCGKKYKNLNGLKYHGKVSHPDMDFRLMVKGNSPITPQF
ncbi:hypothetical protein HK096_004479 [Nowakowskiella sp. JEL0078]|nr:hypothetical protein HK096_004479 [Nowakowskiella sp. JEL0078]